MLPITRNILLVLLCCLGLALIPSPPAQAAKAPPLGATPPGEKTAPASGPTSAAPPTVVSTAPGQPAKRSTSACPACPACPERTGPPLGPNPVHSLEMRPRRQRLTIERIVFVGNHKTRGTFLRDLLPLKPGISLSPDDPRLQQARLRLKSLGLFIRVDFAFLKGSARGKVILEVTLVERGTLLIKHIFGGTSRIIPFWAGLGLEERNFLGRGLTLGLSAVGTAKPQIMGGRSQAAVEAYAFLPSTFSLPVYLGAHFNRGSEFYQTYGDSDSGDPANFLSMQYYSFGLMGKTYFPVGPFFLHTGFDSNMILADIPSEAVRHLEDGRTKNIDFGLKNDLSASTVFFMKLVYDSRNRPVLPSSGSLVEVTTRLGSPLTGSNYTFLKGEFLASRFFALGQHVFSAHLYGAAMMGNPPLFEKIYIGDIQDLIPQRALGLNLSVAPSPNFMGTGITDMRWGTAAAKATVRYDYTFYKGERFIYRANFFVSAGALMLSTATRLRYREGDFWDTAPIDLTANFGIHLDTRVGIFLLSISNILGRLPL